ncbi:MAG: hypothetical protein IT449_15260 [Phycisphaerales bacterium]|nr:hypothetical protein [Phycisphaerales bacterium]
MITQQRMSPFTALFLAIGFVAVSAIGAGTVITLVGLKVADDKATSLLALSEDAVANLPEFIDKLPPAIADMLHDRRAPQYVSNLVTNVRLAEDPGTGLLIPSVEIVNNGTEIVSMLGVRITLLNQEGAPLYEWNQLAAAPITFEELRGPLLPGTKRYVVLPGRRGLTRELRGQLTGAVEISELRVWAPQTRADGATEAKGENPTFAQVP